MMNFYKYACLDDKNELIKALNLDLSRWITVHVYQVSGGDICDWPVEEIVARVGSHGLN